MGYRAIILFCIWWGASCILALADPIVYEVKATIETDPVPHAGDRADDATIWVHPTEPSQSVVIGTDKDDFDGGLAVYDLSGRQLHFVGRGKMNNVDVRYNIVLGNEKVDVVAVGNRTNNSIAVYKIDTQTRNLIDVAARTISIGIEEAYGFCLYLSCQTGKLYAFVNDKNGEVEQWELFDGGGGRIDGTAVRRFDVGGQTEGMVADDQLGYVYVGEEDIGIWKYHAEPNAPADDANRVMVDTTGIGGHLAADVEGLTMYYARDGQGYLIASSQGEGSPGHPLVDTFAVYRRDADNRYVMSFRIVENDALGMDRVSNTDGIGVTSAALGMGFPQGMFVAQDSSNAGGNQNFKLVPWESIATVVKPNLEIDARWDPRSMCGTQATIITVDDDGPADFNAIQPAIDDAKDGDMVIVAEGVYYGNVNFGGKNIAISSADPKDAHAVSATIINGRQDGPVVTFANAEGPDCVLSGFTITGARGNPNGGAIYCRASSPAVRDSIITENEAYFGAGVLCYDSSPSIVNCIFEENSATSGAAIFNFRGSPKITGCTFRRNTARDMGGGICTHSMSGENGLVLVNCIFSTNTSGMGGAICINGGHPTIANCTISDNYAFRCGGISYYSPPGGHRQDGVVLANTILWANTDSWGAGESAQIYNRVCYEWMPVVTYCCIQGLTGALGGYGNISSDPCFAHPGYWGANGTPEDASDDFWADGDYHLMSEGWRWDVDRGLWIWDDVTSRCIDAGNPGSSLGDEMLSVPHDPNNKWGENLRINMGAYGRTAEASIPPYRWALLGDLSNDGIVDFRDLAHGLENWLSRGDGLPADLNRTGIVEMVDFALLAKDWFKRTTWRHALPKRGSNPYPPDGGTDIDI